MAPEGLVGRHDKMGEHDLRNIQYPAGQLLPISGE